MYQRFWTVLQHTGWQYGKSIILDVAKIGYLWYLTLCHLLSYLLMYSMVFLETHLCWISAQYVILVWNHTATIKVRYCIYWENMPFIPSSVPLSMEPSRGKMMKSDSPAPDSLQHHIELILLEFENSRSMMNCGISQIASLEVPNII